MTLKKIDVKLGVDNAQLKAGLLSSQALIANTLNTLKTSLGGLAIGLGIKQIGDFAVKASSDFEQSGISFKVMLGSAEKAQKLLKDIEAMASVTPFETADLNENAKLLLNFGENLSQILPDLQMLGDISGGNKEKMSGLTLAFAQSSSAGRLMGQDLMQMINAGFNPLQTISEKTGKSIGVLKDEMSKGKITFDMVRQAFKDATSEGGKFNNMMQEQGESLDGLKSTKMDGLTIWSRNISDRAMPALKEFEKAQIDVIDKANETTTEFFEWAKVNNEVLGSIKDLGVTLGALAVGIPLANIAILALMASMRSFGVVTATTSAYQIAFATLLKGEASLAMLQYRSALLATTIQIKAFTASLFATPLGWLIILAGGAAAAFYTLKTSAESTKRAIEEINNTQTQNVNKTKDAISTIKELQGAQNLNLEQTKKLDSAIAFLTAKYPKYADRLRDELRLKGEITKATAMQIAQEIMLAKVKGLKEQRDKLDKDMSRDRFISELVSPTGYLQRKGEGRWGVTKANQLRDNELKAQEANEAKELQAIYNDIIGTKTQGVESTKNGEASKTDEKGAKKAAKEALDLKLAQLEATKLATRKSYDEIYQIEVQKLDAKLAHEKRGTAAYQNILNEHKQLDIDYINQTRDFEIKSFENTQKLKEFDFEVQKANLQHLLDMGKITQEEFLKLDFEIEEKKINLLLEANDLKAKLYADDKDKYLEYAQVKLELEKQFTLTKIKYTQDLEKEKYKDLKKLSEDFTQSLQDGLSNILQGNADIQNGFSNLFNSIKKSWADTVAQMIAKKAEFLLFGDMDKGGGFLKIAGNFISDKLFGIKPFATGGVVPGAFNQPIPILAHGSELVLNPFQQSKLWNIINGGSSGTGGQQQAQSGGAPVIINQISPSFQSLDPALGQKMFNDWMKQSGIPLVRTSIKNNDFQMRDTVKNV